MFDQVDRKLESLEFVKDKAGTSIQEIHPAQVPKVPNNNKRLKYMAIAPVAVLFSLWGLFLILGHDRSTWQRGTTAGMNRSDTPAEIGTL